MREKNELQYLMNGDKYKGRNMNIFDIQWIEAIQAYLDSHVQKAYEGVKAFKSHIFQQMKTRWSGWMIRFAKGDGFYDLGWPLIFPHFPFIFPH